MTASRYQRSDTSDSIPAGLCLEQYQWDFALGALLVAGVVAVLAGDERPHPGTLLRRGDPRPPPLGGLADDPHLYRRVVAQVEEPGRMDVIAAARGDDHVRIAFLQW